MFHSKCRAVAMSVSLDLVAIHASDRLMNHGVFPQLWATAARAETSVTTPLSQASLHGCDLQEVAKATQTANA